MKRPTLQILPFLFLFVLLLGCENSTQQTKKAHKASLLQGVVGTLIPEGQQIGNPTQKLFIATKLTTVMVDDATGQANLEQEPGTINASPASKEECIEFDTPLFQCQWSEEKSKCECICSGDAGENCSLFNVDGIGTVLIDPIITDDMLKLLSFGKIREKIRETFAVQV
ncbi:MAG TPA: hypothetical protein ENJ82_10240, partial [Bacteroidetes bacterium]|nr:hypothetical protein [Bacteroidota bacterium]